MKLKVQPHVAWQMVGTEAVVMDLASGRTVGFNPTGSFIWSRLAAGDDHGLVEAFAARFHVSNEAATSDVAAFLAYLVEQNLVAPA